MCRRRVLRLLRLMRVSVDRDHGVVRAGLLGFIGDGLAVVRPGAGCTVVPDGNLEIRDPCAALRGSRHGHGSGSRSRVIRRAGRRAAALARGRRRCNHGGARSPARRRLLSPDPAYAASSWFDDGRIVAERYGAGFSAATPLLGWSMTKSVLAALVGILVKDGRLALDQSAGWPATGDRARHSRRRSACHVERPALQRSLRRRVRCHAHAVPATRHGGVRARAAAGSIRPGEFWSYSSGTANILSRIVQDAAAPLGAAYPAERLFKPLGMQQRRHRDRRVRHLVGSSYMYATARDWARYAQFLLQQGVWRGEELLPPGYVAMMASPVAASGGEYGRGLVWLWGSDALAPGKNPDAAFGITRRHLLDGRP